MTKTLKKRRHSGRITPRFAIKGKYSELIADALEPQEFWDDWMDYRDGFRGDNDRKHIRKIPINSFKGRIFDVKRWNNKLKKLNKIREAKKKRKVKMRMVTDLSFLWGRWKGVEKSTNKIMEEIDEGD